jgi:hypothetical protein
MIYKDIMCCETILERSALTLHPDVNLRWGKILYIYNVVLGRKRHSVLFRRGSIERVFIYLFIYLPEMQQSVRGHSAAVLTGRDSDMQGIHPVMYRP